MHMSAAAPGQEVDSDASRCVNGAASVLGLGLRLGLRLRLEDIENTVEVAEVDEMVVEDDEDREQEEEEEAAGDIRDTEAEAEEDEGQCQWDMDWAAGNSLGSTAGGRRCLEADDAVAGRAYTAGRAGLSVSPGRCRPPVSLC